MFLNKGIYIKRENTSELLIHLNIEELTKFIKTHYDDSGFNEKNLPIDNNISLSSDGIDIILKMYLWG